MAGEARNSLDTYPERSKEDRPEVPELPLTPLEVATFIESMAAELRGMARSAKLDTLAYFLEMTRVEASIQIEQIAARTKR
jgi:hypothetical protein